MRKMIVFIGLCLLVAGSLFAAPERGIIIEIDRDYVDSGGDRFTVLYTSKDGVNEHAIFLISDTVGDYFGRNVGQMIALSAKEGQEIVYDKRRATDEFVMFDSNGVMYDFSLITVISWDGIPIRM